MLSQFLVSELFAFLLIFCRLGSAIMLLPGFGEIYVAVRVRLMLAIFFSLTLTPALASALPAAPATTFGVFTLLLGEIMTGLFLGMLARLLIAAIHIGGMIIAYQSSLASALLPDISQVQGQGTSLGNLLGIVAVVLIFATDLHHMMLKTLADSYTLFLPGQFPLVEDFANHATQTVSGAFRMAMQISAPHLVIGVILYLGAGIISRLMPNIQIFFILMPPQILLSFFILMIAFSSIMMWYLNYFRDALSGFLAP
jgi:flagellar biosynthetic protein FliR